MAISFIGAGTWAISTTSGATLSYAFPAAYTKTAGDIMILVSGGWTGGTTAPTVPTSFTLRNFSYRTPGGGSIMVLHEWKLVGNVNEATPTRTVPTNGNWSSSGNTWNLSGYMLVFRGVDQNTPFDATETISNSGAANTFVPSAITTTTANALVLVSAISGDNNRINLSVANSYSGVANGTNYSSSTVGLEAFGSFTRTYASAGSTAGTMPTLNQSQLGPDSWATITSALRAATAPGQPTGVSATITGSTTATVNWTAGATGNSGTVTYYVDYSTDQTNWTSAGTSTTTSKAVTGLSGNLIYYFRVLANNSIGNSSLSSTSAAKTTNFADAPSAVTVNTTTITTSTMSVSWTAPTGNGTTGYTVYYSSDGGSSWLSTAGSASPTTITGLKTYQSYIFKVSATNATQTSANSAVSVDYQTDTDGEIIWGTRF